MPYQPTTFVAPRLLATILGMALLGSTYAHAQERITLEVIGAVHMATAQEVRRFGSETQRSQVLQSRAVPTDHAAGER